MLILRRNDVIKTKKFKNGDFSLLEAVTFHNTFGSSRRKEFTAYLIECLLKLPQGKIDLKEFSVWGEKLIEKISFDQKEFRADVVAFYKNTLYNLETYTILVREGITKL